MIFENTRKIKKNLFHSTNMQNVMTEQIENSAYSIHNNIKEEE